ncbi:MAG: hypothetical protein ABFR97_04280 [Thermodesulfobacteriota bacterium]
MNETSMNNETTREILLPKERMFFSFNKLQPTSPKRATPYTYLPEITAVTVATIKAVTQILRGKL